MAEFDPTIGLRALQSVAGLRAARENARNFSERNKILAAQLKLEQEKASIGIDRANRMDENLDVLLRGGVSEDSDVNTGQGRGALIPPSPEEQAGALQELTTLTALSGPNPSPAIVNAAANPNFDQDRFDRAASVELGTSADANTEARIAGRFSLQEASLAAQQTIAELQASVTRSEGRANRQFTAEEGAADRALRERLGIKTIEANTADSMLRNTIRENLGFARIDLDRDIFDMEKIFKAIEQKQNGERLSLATRETVVREMLAAGQVDVWEGETELRRIASTRTDAKLLADYMGPNFSPLQLSTAMENITGAEDLVGALASMGNLDTAATTELRLKFAALKLEEQKLRISAVNAHSAQVAASAAAGSATGALSSKEMIDHYRNLSGVYTAQAKILASDTSTDDAKLLARQMLPQLESTMRTIEVGLGLENMELAPGADPAKPDTIRLMRPGGTVVGKKERKAVGQSHKVATPPVSDSTVFSNPEFAQRALPIMARFNAGEITEAEMAAETMAEAQAFVAESQGLGLVGTPFGNAILGTQGGAIAPGALPSTGGIIDSLFPNVQPGAATAPPAPAPTFTPQIQTDPSGAPTFSLPPNPGASSAAPTGAATPVVTAPIPPPALPPSEVIAPPPGAAPSDMSVFAAVGVNPVTRTGGFLQRIRDAAAPGGLPPAQAEALVQQAVAAGLLGPSQVGQLAALRESSPQDYNAIINALLARFGGR